MSYDTLVNISLALPKASLTAVVGPVGSGKSSLIQAILGEMWIKAGHIHLNGSVAYVEQEPWILSATIRENIIMDKPFDQSRYQAVIEACSLISDFNTMTHGDATTIGDRGVNLSGG